MCKNLTMYRHATRKVGFLDGVRWYDRRLGRGGLPYNDGVPYAAFFDGKAWAIGIGRKPLECNYWVPLERQDHSAIQGRTGFVWPRCDPPTFAWTLPLEDK